jgi:membrane protease subunit HflC
MRNWLLWGVGLVVLAFVVAFMFTYTVRFNEVAVRARFGKAGEAAIDTPGLKLKIPGVDSVVKYDQRARFKESKPETQQTRDDRQVIATAYVTWRIKDARTFYERFSGKGVRPEQHYDTAENEIIEKQLRAAMSQISRFRLDELLAADPAQSKLGELEGQMSSRLNETLAADGIEVVNVGFTSLRLPESVTKAVADRMKAERERLASQTEQAGKATAEAIRSKATADAAKIVAFSQQLAGEIRARGEAEAAQYIKQLQQNPQLAIFIKTMDLMEKGINTDRATLVLTPATPGLGLMRFDALSGLKPGQVPDGGMAELLKPFLPESQRIEPASAETEADETAQDDGTPRDDDAAVESISRSGS